MININNYVKLLIIKRSIKKRKREKAMPQEFIIKEEKKEEEPIKKYELTESSWPRSNCIIVAMRTLSSVKSRNIEKCFYHHYLLQERYNNALARYNHVFAGYQWTNFFTKKSISQEGKSYLSVRAAMLTMLKEGMRVFAFKNKKELANFLLKLEDGDI